MKFETHDDRTKAVRNLKEEYRKHLLTEISEKLTIIEANGTEADIGNAYHDAIQITGAVI